MFSSPKSFLRAASRLTRAAVRASERDARTGRTVFKDAMSAWRTAWPTATTPAAKAPAKGAAKPSARAKAKPGRAGEPDAAARAKTMPFGAGVDLGALFQGPLARGPAAPRGPVPVDPLPEGARFGERVARGPAGERGFKLYEPASGRGRALPLVVMLHGCTQDPDDFAFGTGMNFLAEEFGVLVAYPRQPQAANAQKCWNWFRPGDQERGRGEPETIAVVVRTLVDEGRVEEGRVFAAGLSAGGAAAAILGAAYPELFAAVGVHSGLPHGAAHDVASAFAAMRGPASSGPRPRRFVPTIVFHGDADRTVHPSNGEAVVERAFEASQGLSAPDISQGRSEAGVEWTRRVRRDATDTAALEHWSLQGRGHAWSGGRAGGSHVDPKGPDASREMLRFFLDRPPRG